MLTATIFGMEKESEVLTSNCTCENEDGTPSDDCFDGICYKVAMDAVIDLVNTWDGRLGTGVDSVLVEGKGMGWRGVSGSKVVGLYEVPESLNIEGDFTVTFTLAGSTLTATRSSHDEPTGGATFTFTPCAECDDCGGVVKVTLVSWGTGNMAQHICQNCGTSYDMDVD